jgi:predicted ATPase
MAINEPETSLHPELLGPLAEMMLSASRTTQLWVTTHSRTLAEALTGNPRALLHEIQLRDGRTTVRGAHPLGLRQ